MAGTPDTAGALRAAFVDGATTATAICEAVLARIAARERRTGRDARRRRGGRASPRGGPRRAGRPPARRAAGRRARRRQGQPLHSRPHDDRRLARAGELRAALQRDRRRAPRARRRDRRRQDQLRRVRHGLVDRTLGLRSRRATPGTSTRTPGGSSGGSAAAVAAGLVPVALGSDTGGSVRQPAALCGCVGVRPTYGRVSRHGLVAFASSLDQIGPLTMTVRDAAAVLRAIAGPDALDATTAAAPVPDWEAALGGDLRGCRIGFPAHLLERGVDAEVAGAVTSALEVIASRGAEVRDDHAGRRRPGRAGVLPCRHSRSEFESGALRRRAIRASPGGRGRPSRDV